MVEPEPTVRGGPLVSLLHWGGYLAFCVAATTAVGVITAVVMVARTLGSGSPPPMLDDSLATDPTFLGLTTLATVFAMVLGAALGAALLPTRPGALGGFDPRPRALARAHGLRPFHPIWLAPAVLSTVGLALLPGWVVEQILRLEVLGELARSLRTLTEVLADPTAPGWIWVALAVGLSAPIGEELVFRGYLWRAAEHGAGPVATWLLTSAIFAAYHLNPIHVLAVFPVGLLFGWLRWQSGSVLPSMVAHFTNNALALGLAVALGPDAHTPLLVAVGTFAGALVVALGAWYLAPRSKAVP